MCQGCLVCRVCGLAQPDCLEIFGSEGEKRKLPDKVHKCLPIAIRSDDDLSTAMCASCRDKLDIMHDFFDLAIKACHEQIIALRKSKTSPLDLATHLGQYLRSFQPPAVPQIKLEPSSLCDVSLDIADEIPDMDKDDLDADDPDYDPRRPLFEEGEEPDYEAEDSSAHFRVPKSRSTRGRQKRSVASTTRRAGRKKLQQQQPEEDVFEELQLKEDDNKALLAGKSRRGRKRIIPIALKACAICEDILCQSNDDLLAHWKLKHPDEEVRYRCRIDQCDFVAHFRDEIYAHRPKHKKAGIDGGVLGGNKADHTEKCPVCSQEIPIYVLYNSHLQSHVDVKDLQCLKCNDETVTYLTARDLAEHVKQTHQAGLDDSKYTHCCELCGKRFTQRANLEAHLRIHSGYKPFTCDFCGKTFSQKGNMEEHRRTHTGEKPFVCEQCGSAFVRRSELILHNRCVHTGERPYQCVYCPKNFQRRDLLRKHERTHTNTRPYSCDYCQKSFTQRDKMVVHRRLHTGERPYVCDFCGKGFCESGNLKKHLRVHGKEAPSVVHQNNKGKPAPPQGTVNFQKSASAKAQSSEASSALATLSLPAELHQQFNPNPPLIQQQQEQQQSTAASTSSQKLSSLTALNVPRSDTYQNQSSLSQQGQASSQDEERPATASDCNAVFTYARDDQSDTASERSETPGALPASQARAQYAAATLHPLMQHLSDIRDWYSSGNASGSGNSGANNP